MTSRLTKLRIAGFKSFAEATTLEILPGLTGIVGPNGCGKSNVVEALRWAMGETSARSLRGGEMDDVIFAGTTARASRNLAEVTITLEPNGEGAPLPQPFEAETELQITRRIERGAGSQFRANGRELRARDVQTLYADLASGARSSGMVSQGRVSQLVNAKPEERRQVLEEAAGITGLHARRHEAELKLRAAEQNLLRAEDSRVQMEASREALRKQARQSARYRNISGLIRAAEAEHLSVLHAQAQHALAEAQQILQDAHAQAEAASAEVAISAEAYAEAEAAVPAPREAEAQARSTLERRRVEAESLAAESARLAQEAAEAEARLLDLEVDCTAADRARADAQASVQRLTQEAARLEARLTELPAELAAAQARHEATHEAAAQAQHEADTAASRAHENQARLRQAEQALAEAEQRAAEMHARHAAVLAEHTEAAQSLIGADRLEAAEAALAAAHTKLASAKAALEAAEIARSGAERTHLAARGQAERAQAAAQVAQRALAEAVSRAAAFSDAVRIAEAALQTAQAHRVAPDVIEAALAESEQSGTAESLAEAELHAAELHATFARDALAEATRHAEDAKAARVRAEAALSAAKLRAEALVAEAARAEAEEAETERDAPAEAEVAAASTALQEAEQRFAVQEAALKRLQAGRARASAALAEARALLAAAESEEARLAAEADGLRAALGSAGQDAGILDALQVPDGLEAALGAGFGDAGEASLDEGAARFFRALPPAEHTPADLPIESRLFDTLIEAPPALARALHSLVLLDSAEDGDAVQRRLPPGMSAVTREGACWRWDGQVIRAGAPNAAAVRLRQSNRLRTVLAARETAATATDAARAGSLAAEQDEATAQAFEDEARTGHAEAEQWLRASRDRSAAISAQAAQADARRAMLRPVLQRIAESREAAHAALEAAEQHLHALAATEDPAEALAFAKRRAEAAAHALEGARAARAALRTRLAEAQSAVARLRETAREAEARILHHTQQADRARADHAASRAAQAEAEAAVAALPNEAAVQAAYEAAAEAEARALADEESARQARTAAEHDLEAARGALAALQHQSVQAEGRFATASRVLERGAEDLRLAEAALQTASSRVAALPPQDDLIAAQEAARDALEAARKNAFEARARLHALEAEALQADAAKTLATQDLAAWQIRLEEATERCAGLASRRDAARAAHKALGDAPAAIAARSEKSGAALREAEVAHSAAQGRLAAVEQRVRALALARRDAELLVASRREALLRAEAAADAAHGALAAVLARAAERLGADAAIPDAAADSDDAEERARKKFERLTRERDEMGPVNLRAELELEELDQRLATLEQEREELTTAIAKLRGSIGHLNREGRTRLEAVFQQVDQHFRTLFTRMMGGGRAHLALTGSDDPLMAGLEIYAEPPGKKLSALSLLSGGEQALTALSLIFAVFRCTPAPISVLDEVDAPLDDANVERFCTLLDDVVRDTGTRFLVVTHHQLTMSRMDRLFGVTMQERGVSRLLSVDLQRAAAMVEPQLQAAE
jgi:chromosome segregation protein